MAQLAEARRQGMYLSVSCTAEVPKVNDERSGAIKRDQTRSNAIENSEKLAAILKQLSTVQIRYCVARVETKTDKEAAEVIGVSPGVVRSWDDKALVDEAVSLMAFDGVITALELRRRHLAKAMAVKVSGLESDNEKVRQEVATEIIEWELGKAIQRNENKNETSGSIEVKAKHDYRSIITPLAPGSVEDSASSSEDENSFDGPAVG